MISVWGIYKSNGPMEIHLEKDGIELTLDEKEWDEAQATLKGKRQKAVGGIKEGTFDPETIIVYNHKTKE